MSLTRVKAFLPTAAVAAMSLVISGSVHAQGSVVTSFEKIAEGGNGAPGFTYREVGQASINQSGRVAFNGQDNSRFTGVYTTPGGNGAVTTTIAAPALSTGATLSNLSMNASGTVAYNFTDTTTNHRKVFSGNGGPLTYVSDPATAPGLPNFSLDNLLVFPSINDAGVVEYGASSFNAANGQSSYFVGLAQNGVYTPVVQATNPGNLNGVAFNNFNDAHLNNAGQVAYSFTAPVTNRGFVYRRNADGTTTTIATQIQPATTVQINDRGFVSYVSLNNLSLLLGNGVTTTTIGTAATLDTVSGRPLGGYASFAAFNGDYMSVNNLNQVAFKAGGGSLNAPFGIYVSDGTSLLTVAQIGGTLFGSTITGLDMSYQALNDLGQVVFTATLADGRTEIVRGTLPGAGSATAPEPTSLLFLCAGIFAVGLFCLRLRGGRSYADGGNVTLHP